MRTIGVVTVGRSDYGIYLPILRQIVARPELNLRLIVSGMHMLPKFGRTIDLIRADGFEVSDELDFSRTEDGPEAMTETMGRATVSYGKAFTRSRPDLLLLLGDRFEMHAAAVAALPLRLPVAHIHGGELTFGAIDDALRHSMTKLSHLHFVSTIDYARRVKQLGEEPWRILVSGAPSLDNLRHVELLGAEQFAKKFEVDITRGFLLVTYHPETLDFVPVKERFEALLSALRESNRCVLVTLANADAHGAVINDMIRAYVHSSPHAHLVENLGTQGYFSAMELADAMIGNSSSGIIEAASFRLPVVNIGSRQAGRIRAANVIDCGNMTAEIKDAIARATSNSFRESLVHLKNPYGDGHAAERIVDRLASQELGETLLVKRFQDIE